MLQPLETCKVISWFQAFAFEWVSLYRLYSVGVEGENRNRKSLQFGEAPAGKSKSLNIGGAVYKLNAS